MSKRETIISFNVSLALVVLLLAHLSFLATCLPDHVHHDPMLGNGREALEIIIGGGGSPPAPPPDYQDCPPPPPPPCPPPPSPYPFESKRIEIVYPVIQKFKQKIKYDPYGITKTWIGPDICNKYKGFICDTLIPLGEKALAGVKFNGFNLDGPDLNLDSFIDELPDIMVFHANSNNFKGAFPLKISKIKYLYELDLSNNKYSCEFPYEVLGATKLTFLDLRFNSFYGMLPPQVFMLDVDVLYLNNNNFTQKLPDNLGSTPALYLTLAHNKFTGPIPKTIGQAHKTLTEVLLLDNQLSGCLPCEIGLLEKATVFDASRNLLTGPIPQSFACLAQMQILNLANNQLYGPVPELVCKLANLGNLSLSYNYFTKVGPECRKLINKNVLDLTMNCIPGLPGQRSPAQCHAFFSKARSCPDEGSFSWMPCNANSRRNSLELSDSVSTSTGSKEPSRSYAALHPHRL
ncbi:uncharacterized protein At4g06744-like [Sesamum indicum]|uniref:Uncharacterized protein At4g06744-like n=1 Tax=Sesamum indicum TaxID=4182 RepID=A0A6I9U311_SESIN|nr:uncharacterized protein At4g06744-like [Sesamum indicum]